MSECPMPPYSSLKRTGFKKRVRSKPRPGRLKGKDMENLRRECFERDLYRCQSEGCGKPLTWNSAHMAHIVSRGRGGKDELSNVTTKCPECHLVIEHQYGPSGIKPCPPK